MNQRIAASAVMASLVVGLCLTGCERGPMQKAGEKVDNTVNDIKK
jgi:hypothetical protein